MTRQKSRQQESKIQVESLSQYQTF